MILIFGLIFVGVFALVTPLLIVWSAAGSHQQNKQVIATLETALAIPTEEKPAPIVDFRKSELNSAIPWFNNKLATINFVPVLQRLINQAEMKVTVGALVLICLACFAIPSYLIHLRTGNALIALLVGLGLGFLPVGWVLIKRGKRFKKFEAGLPDALDLMVSALRVGHSFTSAMGLVTRECPDPVGSEFKVAFDEQNFGLDLRTALENMTYRLPLQDLKIVVTAILIQREAGGNLAEVLEKTAYVIRQRFKLRRQVMVHTAQGRMTGWVLTVLPIALGIGLYVVNPDTMRLLWTSEIGIKLLWGGGASLVIGSVIIQKIVHMEV
jgi:tight adherence protein B